MPPDRTDIYTRVTDQIIAELEKGVRPWLKPWNAEHMAGKITRPLRFNGQAVQGHQRADALGVGHDAGLRRPHLDDLQPGQEAAGRHVKAGSKGSLVVYADHLTQADTGDDGEEIERDVYFMKGYTVFNVEQVDGPARPFLRRRRAAARSAPSGSSTADLFFANTGADIRHGGNQAYYAPAPDYVQMPPFEAFQDAESYYATLAHELTHWTKHPTRLDRDFGRKRFGDEGYAREELVAEIGSRVPCLRPASTPEAAGGPRRLSRPLAGRAEGRTSGRSSRPPPMPRKPPITCMPCSRNRPPDRCGGQGAAIRRTPPHRQRRRHP